MSAQALAGPPAVGAWSWTSTRTVLPDEVAHVHGHIDAIRCYVLGLTFGEHRLVGTARRERAGAAPRAEIGGRAALSPSCWGWRIA